MTRKLLTVDEFRDSARDGETPEGTVYRFAVTEPQAVTDGSRKVRFVFSDGTVDRSGDSIDPKGWQIDSFLKNPVALWAHDSSSPPIGRASNVGSASGKLVGDIDFMPAEISPFADSIYKMVTGGYLKAVSVGFMPLDWKFSKEKDRPFGIDFTKQELLEISVCPVPCNPNALQEAKSAGIDTGPIREWASKVLDEGGQILIPRNVLEETFRQAKTPRTTRQKYLAKSAAADWKVGASRDLPIDDADSWDGPAASKRMLDEAGFDGDSPDAAKAARGFLLHDAANPLLRDSYKMPFANLIDGELRAIKPGIIAAKDAATKEKTKKSDAPAILDDALSIILAYQRRSITEGLMTPNQVRAANDMEPAQGEIIAITEKSGRRISNANMALLQEAMDHHASATKCIKDVLGSNTPDDNSDDDNNGDPNVVDDSVPTVVVLSEADRRKQRLEEARALRASVKI